MNEAKISKIFNNFCVFIVYVKVISSVVIIFVFLMFKCSLACLAFIIISFGPRVICLFLFFSVQLNTISDEKKIRFSTFHYVPSI